MSSEQPMDPTSGPVGVYADGREFHLPHGWGPVDRPLLDFARERTVAALHDTAGRSPALDRCAAYYDPDSHFAGTLLTEVEPQVPGEVTAADLWAVCTLSMEVPPLAGRRLLFPGARRSAVNRFLTQIPDTLPITALDAADPAVAGVLDVMWSLYDEFRTVMSTGESDSNRWVFAAKMCARKRPLLFPVRDHDVCSYLSADGKLGAGRPGRFVTDIQIFAFLMTCREIVSALDQLRGELTAAGVRVDTQDLRLLDVVLWTAAQGM